MTGCKGKSVPNYQPSDIILIILKHESQISTIIIFNNIDRFNHWLAHALSMQATHKNSIILYENYWLFYVL